MTINTGDAFEQFKTTYPKTSIGKTYFYKNRSAHVLSISDTSCVEVQYTKIINLRLDISKHAIDFPKRHRELLNKV